MYRWMSMQTGEIVEDWKSVLKIIWVDFAKFHYINIKWKHNKKGW